MNPGQQWVWRACQVFVDQGRVLPTLWAQSDTDFVLAVPTEDATVSGLVQPMLLGLIAQTVEADFVGIVNEVWVKEFDTYDEVEGLHPGDLAALSDTDPRVRTAVICTWAPVATAKVRSEMATFSLTDDGEVEWLWSESDEPVGPIADMVRMIASHEGIAVPDPFVALEKVAEGLGWHVLGWSL